MSYWIVELKTEVRGKKKSPPLYISVDRGSGSMRLVKTRQGATKFETEGLARLVSEHFWETAWATHEKLYNLWSREAIFCKSPKRKDRP